MTEVPIPPWTELVPVSWTLSAYLGSTWAKRYSKLHLQRKDGKILCGAKPGIEMQHNHEGKCQRCWSGRSEGEA